MVYLSLHPLKFYSNDIPGKEIQHQLGLRQGVPLSPMLFVIIMDVYEVA